MTNDPFLSEMSIIELANRVALTTPPHQIELTNVNFDTDPTTGKVSMSQFDFEYILNSGGRIVQIRYKVNALGLYYGIGIGFQQLAANPNCVMIFLFSMEDILVYVGTNADNLKFKKNLMNP